MQFLMHQAVLLPLEIIFLHLKSAFDVLVYLISSRLHYACCGMECERNSCDLLPVLTLASRGDEHRASASFQGGFDSSRLFATTKRQLYSFCFIYKSRDPDQSIKLLKLIFSDMEQENLGGYENEQQQGQECQIKAFINSEFCKMSLKLKYPIFMAQTTINLINLLMDHKHTHQFVKCDYLELLLSRNVNLIMTLNNYILA